VREEKNPDELLNFKLIFEADDIEPLEFCSPNPATLKWLELLRMKICILDYQQFFELDKLVGQGSFASVFNPLKI
jgi:hypothetical protein